MYSFSDFSTVKDLSDVMTVSQLSAAIGLSLTQTYRYIEKVKIPYVQISKRKIIFKEHLLQAIKGSTRFTDVAELKAIKDLPEVFSPRALKSSLHISFGFANTISKYPGFPSITMGSRIIVNKPGFIQWIRDNQKEF